MKRRTRLLIAAVLGLFTPFPDRHFYFSPYVPLIRAVFWPEFWEWDSEGYAVWGFFWFAGTLACYILVLLVEWVASGVKRAPGKEG